jgi:methyl-accepting chemotaxis protein
MDEIIDSVDKTLELVRDLNIKSKDVEKVIEVIADVTKQTNLLSLNAAILAAQAGEYGKGFSVVADEIKTLADKTASSAKEITDIIKAIQNGITEVAHVTENSKIIVENGNALVIRTGEALNDVIEGAQKSAEMANTIQKATKEQVKGIVQIKESMEMITLTAEHVTKATHEHEIGSEHLLGVSEKVKEVSDLIKRSMQEQNVGIRMISKNLELTNEGIKQIADGTSEQGKTNDDILSAAERIRVICHNTLVIAQEMVASFNSLYQESEALSKDMEGFKLE